LADLEQLLTQAHDQHPAIAKAMHEALTICQSRHVAHAGTHFQLRNALESIRIDRPDDATRYIQNALDIQARWVGGRE
jgi:hypothetical protein